MEELETEKESPYLIGSSRLSGFGLGHEPGSILGSLMCRAAACRAAKWYTYAIPVLHTAYNIQLEAGDVIP